MIEGPYRLGVSAGSLYLPPELFLRLSVLLNLEGRCWRSISGTELESSSTSRSALEPRSPNVYWPDLRGPERSRDFLWDFKLSKA